MKRGRPLPLVVLLAVAGAASCSTAPHDDSAHLVVGVQTEEMGGVVGDVHVVTTLDGVVKSDERSAVDSGAPPFFPHEVRIDAPRSGGHLAVMVEAFGAGATSGPLLTRTAETTMPAGATRLLRLRMEERCLTRFGGGNGPTCTAPQTCTDGRCTDDTLLPDDLETYRPDWAADPADVCRPIEHGAPVVIAGTGQADYAPITDGQTLQAELGPQGGHHLWIALRMKNLRQVGSTTTVSAVQPGTNVPIPPTAFVLDFAADSGGYCALYGLRYQLDNGGLDYRQFLGKPLDVTIDVRDTTGGEAQAVAHIRVAPTCAGE